MGKWQTDLQAGDRFEFTGLTGQEWPGAPVTRQVTITGITHTGDVEFRLDLFTPTDDRIGNGVPDRANLLVVLEMINQGIWREVKD